MSVIDEFDEGREMLMSRGGVIRCLALGACIALAGLACSSSKSEKTPDQQRAAAKPVPQPAGPKAPVPPQPGGGREKIAGLEVSWNPAGYIRIQGKDVFGKPFDTTYESAKYLGNALPVLTRSLTPKQTEGLKGLVARLPSQEKKGASSKSAPRKKVAGKPGPASRKPGPASRIDRLEGKTSSATKPKHPDRR